MTWYLRAGACALALGLGTAPEASGGASDAPSDGRPTPLPPVTVPLPPTHDLPESPARRDPTGAFSVIDVRPLRAEAKVASEVLAAAPGVVVHQRGGLLQSSQLSLRGAASTGVLVLLDGVPLNGAGGTVDLSRIPLSMVDRVEVLRGAGARYAPGGLGGVVNVVTRSPEGEGTAAGGLTFGSFGTALVHASTSSPLLGGQGLLLLHGARSEGGFGFGFDPTPALDDGRIERRTRLNNDAQLAGALMRYRRSLFEVASVDASAELAFDQRGLAGTAQNPTEDVRMGARRLHTSARATLPLHAGELAARAWLKRDESRFAGGLFGAALAQRETSVGLEAEGSTLWRGWHGLSAVAQVGADALTEPGGANPSWVRSGVGLSDELLLVGGRLSLVPSVRADLTGPFFTFSPKLGARAELPKGFEVSANAGQAHRPPSFLELYVVQGNLLPNSDLRPERALFADVTVAHRSSRSRVALTAFHALYEDLIAYEYYPPFLARPYNFSAAQVQGLEAEGEVRLATWARAGAAYTHTRTLNLRDDPRYYRQELPYRPRHRLAARVSGGPQWLQLRAEGDSQSQQYMNRTNRLALPSRTLLNAGATVRAWKAPDLRLSLDVKNLLDQQAQDFDGYPLPGRAFYLTLSFALERSFGEKGDVKT
jgi:vitamin B12 transporter